MSEAAPGAELPSDPDPDDVTAGALLRRAREAAGLHVASLAVSLKVPVRKLEALEADRHELLTDAVFARALASSVCRTLKIDPKPILERLPRSSAPRLLQDRDGINAPYRAPGDMAGPAWYEQLPRPAVIAVGGLLLGAAVIMLWPAAQRDEPALAARPQPLATAPVPSADAQAAGTPAAPVLSMTLAIPTAPAASAAPALVAAPAPAGGATALAPTAAPASAAAAPAPAGPGIVVFRTSAQSWVKVIDARGVPVLEKMMAAGEAVGVSGALPLAVTVGRVDATQVTVRGKDLDLAALARDNVARFEVR